MENENKMESGKTGSKGYIAPAKFMPITILISITFCS